MINYGNFCVLVKLPMASKPKMRDTGQHRSTSARHPI